MRLSIAVLTLMITLVVTPGAWATSVSVDASGDLVVQGGAEANAIFVTVMPGGGISVGDANAPVDLVAAGRCAQTDAHHVTCPFGVIKNVHASGDDGDDTLTTNDVAPAVLEGGAGDDHLTGGPNGDVLRGGAGNDVLDGGGGADLLQGDAGADVLRGGEGDDRVDAADGAPDAEVSCGPGDDHFRADPVADPQPADCELQLARFTGPVVITGSATTGGTLHANAPIAGVQPIFTAATWWSCAPGTGDCTSWRGGLYYPPTGSDVGREISVTLDAFNDTDARFHGLDGTTIVSARVGPVTGDPRYAALARVAPGTSLRTVAASALGGPAVLAAGGRQGDVTAYVRSGRGGILRLTGGPSAVIAVFSRHNIPVAVAQALELRSRSGAVRRVGVAGSSVNATVDSAGVVTARLTAAQRRLVHHARRARLVVTLRGTQGVVVVRFRVPTR